MSCAIVWRQFVGTDCRVIAIDGVGGAGKTTVAFALAKELSASFLPSGSLYRFIAWRLLKGVDLDDALDEVSSLHFPINGIKTQIYFCGEEISTPLQQESVGLFASTEVAPLQQVRNGLLELQRGFAQGSHLVCEGRDMSSVVFPNAHLSIYLTATIDIRRRRRGITPQALKQRDEQDSEREIAPLGIHPQSHIIDTSHAKVGQIVQKIRTLLNLC